ncbi:hypothetical protein PHYSODRAFT_472802 [Phytophthora sojae]|uniref:Uncharacterized protein n=1 Tax=Phytophthora sojae (strain P6497) TaxID=1094619 RepID=G4YHY9_PHYSP|nr:hypothetical protein PHYSODRAFT_472802 [Phytophthora sojae]EGZ26576.1 hypothetical protein PHYSODRAFT_472802 [Phytophthora sojae]|eukprot:XP_009513851.1 hypothetical protein PHYSODRAFT_472802 [Phytophthora sojae]
MSTKVELNKNGRPVNWHGQCWAYYKSMMMIALEDKGVMDYATGKKTLATAASDDEKNTFGESQVKVKQIIMSSLSMELGQQVMTKPTGKDMWKYLEEIYEGKTNAATRTNQEIILFNKLQTTRCKPNWDVRQHINNIDPIFIDMLMRSLPTNSRFDRLRGMFETGASEVDTPDKLKDQILRMDSYNRCDGELGVGGPAAAQNQTPHQAPKQKPQQLPH